jgi:peptidylprolyl isomerase
MVVGEERRIWVPGRFTFTPGEEDEAPSQVDVTFDIELIATIKAPPTPTDVQAAPETAVKTASGLAFRILQKGTGTQHPPPTSRITLHLSGWTTDGALFVSTVRSGHPAVYMVAHLIPGLHEGVLHMIIGEKRRFWIPAALAYGEKSRRRGAPAGDLVYDVELLAVE